MSEKLNGVAAFFSSIGWKVVQITQDAVVITRKRPHSCGHHLVAGLFFPLGLLVYLIDPGDETLIVNETSADFEMARLEKQAKAEKSNKQFVRLLIVGLVVVVMILATLVCVTSGTAPS